MCSNAAATSLSQGNASPESAAGGLTCPTCSMKRSAFDDMWTCRRAVVPKTKSATRSPGVRMSSV